MQQTTAVRAYVAGCASYFEVPQEQQQLFPVANSLVQNQLNQRLALIQLYTVLRGSFGLADNLVSH